MQISLWLIPALAFTGACTATLLACRWWYQRKLEALAQRLQKSEKARLFSSQQTLQARRQIEALQKDMAVQQQAMAEAQVARQKSRHLEEALKAVAEADEEATLALPQNHGFADTQPMA
jgi:hypothetical protein